MNSQGGHASDDDRTRRARTAEGGGGTDAGRIGINTEGIRPTHFGDEMDKKHDKTIRLISHNINGYPLQDIGKERLLQDLTIQTDADIMLWQEININWPAVGQNESLQDRCKGWFRQLHSRVARNEFEKNKTRRHLHGGTAVWTKDGTAARTQGSSSDSLGRWSSVCIVGLGGLQTRIFSVYRPVVNNTSLFSFHIQNLNALLQMNDNTDPQKAFMRDLSNAIQIARDKGERIIVGGDFNTRIFSADVNKLMSDHNLREVHSRHGRSPPTFSGGRTKIDAILISESIQVLKCGYLPYDRSVVSHRPIIRMIPALEHLYRLRDQHRFNLGPPATKRRWAASMS